MLFQVCLLFLVLNHCIAIDYHGFKVYDVIPKSNNDQHFLKSFEKNSDFDFWSSINKVGNPVTILVSPDAQPQFENDLQLREIAYLIKINDVEKTIEQERKYHKNNVPKNVGISFDRYLQLAEINHYLDQLAANYSTLVTVNKIGQSYENHTMKTITISKSSEPKPAIFIEAGMHAREWISPALSVFIINQLVENENNLNLLDGLDWIILPNINPDGYEYTWTTDRFWRKTRSPGSRCVGTDGNRNFGFHWMENGASDDECTEIYAGKSAFSEVETQNLRDVLNATEDIAAFVSLHSYGQLLFYPYSYDSVVPDNWEELDDLARQTNDAIAAVNGTQYTIGASTDILYPAAGCSDDWAMGGAGIPIVLTFELPGGGQTGFDLPPERILPVVTETWEGIKIIADYVRQKK